MICNSKRFIWIFATLLLVNIQFSNSADFELGDIICSEKRFAGQSKLLHLASSLEIESQNLELAELEIARDALIRELNIIPLTLSLDHQFVNSTEFDRPVSKNRSDSSALALKYDLNKLLESAKRDLTYNRINVISSELRSLRGKHFAEKVAALNDIVESQMLDQILLERRDLVERKIEYYNSLSYFGDLKSEEISMSQTEFIELNDKILANEIKRNEKLFFLGLDDLEGFNSSPEDMITPDSFNDNCTYQPENILQLELALIALNITLELKNLSRRTSFSASVSLNQSRANQNYINEIKTGISISIPIFDGGIVNAERHEIMRKLAVENARLRNAKKVASSEVTQRQNTERVLTSSLRSLANKASNDLARFNELQKRLKMGESVFIEKSNKRKEYLETVEAFLRLKYDMIAGWYEFLGRLDGFSKI